ncbi:hypothetical protein JR338_03535 [Chloroflexota bacterium]|nr:hypothetical protein JR338_03535 [Chloroflexota bacterium]
MAFVDIGLSDSYWQTLEIKQQDIEYLYSFLLEKETPLPSSDLASALIAERIRIEKKHLKEKQQKSGDIYLPEKTYAVGDKIQFPAMEWISGEVTAVREGNNPELEGLAVLTVALEDGGSKQFASNLAEHKLNKPVNTDEESSGTNLEAVVKSFGEEITAKLDVMLDENKDLVRIGGNWFPRSLLIEFNVGHLNLAEAVLDMYGGGPLPVEDLLKQIDIETDDPPELVQFSMNYALQEDPRFDEVGPRGIVKWFLNRLEPDFVREKPVQLSYAPVDYDRSILTEDMLVAEQRLDDELTTPDPDYMRRDKGNEVTVTLNFPHWRMGTLPLTAYTRPFFPTAIDTPRVKFTLIDEENEEISAWVVRPNNYIYGLQEWYDSKELIPGSIIHIKPGKQPGEVLIKPEKKRSNREWMRTLLIGTDGGIVFAMLKQTITANFNERMAIAIPSTEVLDELWKKRSTNQKPMKKVMLETMQELAKLNPQGQVHAVELYAAMNCIYRCPPGAVFSLLASSPEFAPVGDLYYRLSDGS